LPFALLADAEHKTAEDYGVWVEKSMYGRNTWASSGPPLYRSQRKGQEDLSKVK